MRTLLSSTLAVLSLIALPAFAKSVTVTINESDVLPNNWVTPNAWPPEVDLSSTNQSSPDCDASSQMVKRERDDVLGWSACITTSGDGAAGSVYYTWKYDMVRDGQRVQMEWTLRQGQCDNYDDPIRSQCKSGQSAFWDAYNPEDVVAAALPQLGALSSAPFSDVPASHPNADAIAYVKGAGIVQGYADGTFRPDATINRAEFVKILVLAKYGGTDCYTEPHFTDVPRFGWFTVSVCVAESAGWVEGYSDGTFRPENAINFAEAAKIIVKAFDPPSRFEINTTQDVMPPWYAYPVATLEDHYAIPTTILSVDQRITRGEMAEIIYRLKTGNEDKPTRTYNDLVSGAVPSPSYPAMQGCVWSDMKAHGWSFWAQECDGTQFYRRIVLSGNVFSAEYSNGTTQPLMEIIPVAAGSTPVETIQDVYIDPIPSERGCALTEKEVTNGWSADRLYEIRTNTRYAAEGPYWMWGNEEICGDHGMTNGLRYFAVYDTAPNSFLFLDIGQSAPPIDMASIRYVGQ